MIGLAVVALTIAPILKLFAGLGLVELIISVWLVLLASKLTVQTGAAATGRRLDSAIPATVRRDKARRSRGFEFIRVPW